MARGLDAIAAWHSILHRRDARKSKQDAGRAQRRVGDLAPAPAELEEGLLGVVEARDRPAEEGLPRRAADADDRARVEAVRPRTERRRRVLCPLGGGDIDAAEEPALLACVESSIASAAVPRLETQMLRRAARPWSRKWSRSAPTLQPFLQK